MLLYDEKDGLPIRREIIMNVDVSGQAVRGANGNNYNLPEGATLPQKMTLTDGMFDTDNPECLEMINTIYGGLVKSIDIIRPSGKSTNIAINISGDLQLKIVNLMMAFQTLYMD